MTRLARAAIMAVVAAAGAAVPPHAASAQEGGDRPTAYVTVSMLAAHINTLAGHRVHVVEGYVASVVSPRLFLLERRSMSRFEHDRVAVLLETGAAGVPRGAAVEVAGTARTCLGAMLAANVPGAAALTDDERSAFRGIPVVIATDVTTPGGIGLIQPL